MGLVANMEVAQAGVNQYFQEIDLVSARKSVAAASRRRTRRADPPMRSQSRDGCAIPRMRDGGTLPRMRDGCGVSPQTPPGRSPHAEPEPGRLCHPANAGRRHEKMWLRRLAADPAGPIPPRVARAGTALHPANAGRRHTPANAGWLRRLAADPDSYQPRRPGQRPGYGMMNHRAL